jgi:hypothetical protein
VPTPLLVPTPTSWRCSRVSLPRAGTQISAWMWWINAYISFGATKKLSTASGMSRSRSSPTSLSSRPSPTPMAHWLLVSWLILALALLVFLSTMKRRSKPTTTMRWRMMSSPLRICASWLFSLFGVLMRKGEKTVISISVFHSSVVCNMDKNLFYVWLVIP